MMKSELKLALKNAETERDAAQQECAALYDTIDNLRDQLDKSNLKITRQRKALRQLNRSVVERNLRHDDVLHRHENLRDNARRLHERDANEIAMLKATLELAQQELANERNRKPWWRP